LSAGPDRRLPAAAYRLLVLLALRHAARPLSKGELAWQVRANHPTITRILALLVDEGLVDLAARDDGGYAITLTPDGGRFAEAHMASLPALFSAPLAEHFRYGARPAWLPTA
jgi:DNA-binding IclR family transcriptional regulator